MKMTFLVFQKKLTKRSFSKQTERASSHTSKSNVFLLNKLFKKDGWMQNPPSSPDLAYPIERILGIIKPRVKRRDPK